MKVALDTNRLSDLFRGDRQLADFFECCEEVWIPFCVLGEIKAGFYGGDQSSKNELALNRLLSKSPDEILLPTTKTVDHYARLYDVLKRSGRPIPSNDLWIAAGVLENNLTLITRDRHFDRLPQLLRI